MTEQSMGTFGDVLRRYRLDAGLSQEALAERAALSSDAIRALERGRRAAPRAQTLRVLAEALGLDTADRAVLVAAAADAVPPESARPAAETPIMSTPPALTVPPAAPDALIGREGEVAALVHIVEGATAGDASAATVARLVTLLGPGGVGKTRLALAAAAALQHAYPDGVVFADLSALRDPALVAPTVARAVGLREDGARDVRDLLLESLRERKLLLILDNFEQVVDAAALVAELIAGCPYLSVLATSRIALQVRAEHRFPVAPLAVPDTQCTDIEEVELSAAVQLFVARARAIQPDFRLEAATAAAVATICRRLDGLPLAIELAAARIALLPPAQLLRRLERRLSVLTQGARDSPARQQTLRATIDWSHALLSTEEQVLFRRLSVCVDGGTLEAIEAICDPAETLDAVGGVASLVDKSLLRAAGGDPPRVTMLETVREYAGEQLAVAGETAALRRAHATYYLTLVEAAEPHLRGAGQAAWLKRLTAEHDNLRAALQWAVEQSETELGWRLGGALWRFWYLQGHVGEGRTWLARLLEVPFGDTGHASALARAQVLSGAGVFAELQGDYPTARALHDESLTLRQQHGDSWGAADSLDDLGVVADSQGDVTRAAALYERALEQFRALGDAWGTALVLSNMGYLAREQGAYARATGLHQESLTLFRQVGDARNVAFTLNNLGEVLCDQGDYSQAQALCEESLALRRELGDTWGVAISLGSLGHVAGAQGHHAQATALYEESVALFRRLGATWNTACALDSLATVARQQGAYTRAEALAAESLDLFRDIHDSKGTARVLGTAAQLAHDQGQRERAETLCHESLALSKELGAMVGVLPCLETLAALLCVPPAEDAPAARLEQGVQLWAATTAMREALGIPRPSAEEATSAAAIAKARAVLAAPAFAAAWTQGATLSLEQAVAQAAGLARG